MQYVAGTSFPRNKTFFWQKVAYHTTKTVAATCASFSINNSNLYLVLKFTFLQLALYPRKMFPKGVFNNIKCPFRLV